MPFATASTFRTIFRSSVDWLTPGLVCRPPSSAARRAPWRTLLAATTLSTISIVVLNPPSRRTNRKGMMMASSTTDWPACFRRSGVIISVGLRLQPHGGSGAELKGRRTDQDARLPVVLVLDDDADKVAGSIGHIPAAGGPRCC